MKIGLKASAKIVMRSIITTKKNKENEKKMKKKIEK